MDRKCELHEIFSRDQLTEIQCMNTHWLDSGSDVGEWLLSNRIEHSIQPEFAERYERY